MDNGTWRGSLLALLSFRGIVLFWIAYGVAHAGLRLAISRTLTLDDSRASELVQSLELGYQVRQPPLYEWLLWTVQQVLGTGIESHLLVRYSLIAALGIATFGAVRAAVKDERWAAAASLSLVFSYPVGWTFHEWATQTLLLSTACMATVHAAIRFFERPGVGPAVWLGLALAIGFYAKFSYPLFLGGLVLAALSMAETRARLWDARLLVVAAIPLVALVPFFAWVMRVGGDPVFESALHMIPQAAPYGERVAVGLRRLAASMVAFLLPWILIAAVLAWPAFSRRPENAPAPSLAERLSLRTMLFAAALAALGIVLMGATTIGARYMHPILIVAPVYVFARIVRLAPAEERLRAFATVALVSFVVVLAVRFVAATDNPLTERAERGLLVPYAALADVLAARGVTDGTVLTSRTRDAGNLRAFLPDLRVISRESFNASPPRRPLRPERPPRRASDERSCVLVWQDGEEGEMSLARHNREHAERIEIAAQSSWIIASRGGTWFVARLEPDSSACS